MEILDALAVAGQSTEGSSHGLLAAAAAVALTLAFGLLRSALEPVEEILRVAASVALAVLLAFAALVLVLLSLIP